MPKMSETREFQFPNALSLKSNLQLEVINIWGVHFVSLSLCQSKCILEVMDYLSKWMKHFLCCGQLEEFKEDDSGNHISLL